MIGEFIGPWQVSALRCQSWSCLDSSFWHIFGSHHENRYSIDPKICTPQAIHWRHLHSKFQLSRLIFDKVMAKLIFFWDTLYIQQQVRVRLKTAVQNKCQIRPKYKFITQYMLRQQDVMVNEQTAIIEID